MLGWGTGDAVRGLWCDGGFVSAGGGRRLHLSDVGDGGFSGWGWGQEKNTMIMVTTTVNHKGFLTGWSGVEDMLVDSSIRGGVKYSEIDTKYSANDDGHNVSEVTIIVLGVNVRSYLLCQGESAKTKNICITLIYI